jgi:hypothetical protein
MVLKGKRAEFIKAAKEAGIPVEPNEALKADNPAGEPAVPNPVHNGRVMAAYVLPHYRTHKDDGNVVEMEFSFPLTPQHRGNLPDGVEEAWRFIDKKNYTSIDVSGVPLQILTIYQFADSKEDDYALHLDQAEIVKARLKKVQEKGKGHVKTVLRFSFRVLCGVRDSGVCVFADREFGKEVWLEMDERQGKLKLDRDPE